MEANQHAYTVSVARPGGKTTLWKPLRTRKDIRMELKQTGWEGVDCIHLPQLLKFLRTQQWTFVEISWLSENLLDSQGLKPIDLLMLKLCMSRPHCSCYRQTSSHCSKLQLSKTWMPTTASDNLQFLDDPFSVQHNCTRVDNGENHKQNWKCRPWTNIQTLLLVLFKYIWLYIINQNKWMHLKFCVCVCVWLYETNTKKSALYWKPVSFISTIYPTYVFSVLSNMCRL
jgi:hypothetical protein